MGCLAARVEGRVCQNSLADHWSNDNTSVTVTIETFETLSDVTGDACLMLLCASVVG